jgi:hypothetical protein
MNWIPELDRRFILCNNPRSDHYGHVLDARHSCQEFDLVPPQDAEWFNDPEYEARWAEESPKVIGVFPERIKNAIARGYCKGILHRPLEEVTDKQFLTVPGLGFVTLRIIRERIPGPESEVINAG